MQVNLTQNAIARIGFLTVAPDPKIVDPASLNGSPPERPDVSFRGMMEKLPFIILSSTQM
jgi:hypothetical protein